MEKICFIIMPISDIAAYPVGHFRRVYEYIIKPAVIMAGFKPVRADDVLNTNYIAIDILKKIITSEMAICDLSSRNPNVLYELGIRQAFDLPVSFIKDKVTTRVFDIQGFRDIEYDESLRVDNVETTIEMISQTISNTYETRQSEEVNSLISLLGIQAAKVSTKHKISPDTELILNTLESFGNRLNQMERSVLSTNTPQQQTSQASQVNDLSGYTRLTVGEVNDLKAGDIVYHTKYGLGKITKLEGAAHNPIAVTSFPIGDKKLMLNYATLYKSLKKL